MKEIQILNETDVRDIVIRELRKRDKIISKLQVVYLIKNEVREQNKSIYKDIDKIRRRQNKLEDIVDGKRRNKKN